MINAPQTGITKDPSGKKLIITREFNAEIQDVWDAWTQSDLLDKWWAPKPWKAETKSMDFTEGGTWYYSMVGPKGERHFNRVDFKTITPPNNFTAIASFCDEEGNISPDFPPMYWNNQFTANGDSTSMLVELSFDSEEGLNKIVEMGFKEGFTMGLGNLDDLLAGM